jgi:hypothetical protein
MQTTVRSSAFRRLGGIYPNRVNAELQTKQRPSTHFFPITHFAGNNPEQRMRRGTFHRQQSAMPFHIPHFQFPLQVPPFIKQLAARFGHFSPESPSADFGRVKSITALHSLLMQRRQITRQRSGRIGEPGKAAQLRMMPVAAGSTAQNLLRQQCLAPERHQPPGVQVFRMQRPQAHEEF